MSSERRGSPMIKRLPVIRSTSNTGQMIGRKRRATSGKSQEKTKLSTDVKIVRGEAPAAGFESVATGDLINFHRSLSEEDLLNGCADLETAFSALLAVVRRIVPEVERAKGRAEAAGAEVLPARFVVGDLEVFRPIM